MPDFLTDPTPDILTDPEGNVDTPTSDDQCQCDKKPKKKKKPKQERTICKKGTYVQTKRGITYHPRETVACSNPEKKSKAKPRRQRSPSLPDLARDVFNLP